MCYDMYLVHTIYYYYASAQQSYTAQVTIQTQKTKTINKLKQYNTSEGIIGLYVINPFSLSKIVMRSIK